MGTPSIRITAADFLTPTELAGHRLAANGAGRIGGACLELVGGASTRVGNCYQQVPVRVLPAFQFSAGQPALIYLLNPTAGLMDGDGQRLELAAHGGSRAVVLGQSATRIHPCLHGFSTQQWHVDVAAGAVLTVLPGPAIPFRGCRYYQHVDIRLAAGAALLWGDIWLCGRYARGTASEMFQFELLVQELTVHAGGRLVFRDRFCWRGPWDETTAAWHFGGQPASGSLLIAGPDAERLVPRLPVPGRSCFVTGERLVCLRYLGSSEAVTGQLVRDALTIAPQFTEAPPATPWLLAHHDLGPNHWFSQPTDNTGVTA
jgi:urease accessory protein